LSQTTEQIQKSDIKDILENSLKGNRPGPEDILRLLESDDVHLMGLVSGYLTKKQFGNKASFVNNIILNYTNVCITDCKFCAFYRSPGAEDSYTLSLDEIETRVKTSFEMFKIRQVLIQGGHNPNLKIEYYEDAFKMIRKKFPTVGVHGADDFGGTLIGEEVVSCTGARSTELTDKIIVDAIHQIGYQVEERDNFYNPIRVL